MPIAPLFAFTAIVAAALAPAWAVRALKLLVLIYGVGVIR